MDYNFGVFTPRVIKYEVRNLFSYTQLHCVLEDAGKKINIKSTKYMHSHTKTCQKLELFRRVHKKTEAFLAF